MDGLKSTSRGQLVAALLYQSWRDSPPPCALSSHDLDAVTPLLYGSGAAALGWWRVRDTSLQGSISAELFHQAYRLQVLFGRIHQTKTQKIVRLLSAAGVESIVIKGWSVARYYPRIGMRPSGDIDLLIRPRDYRAAESVIKSEDARDCWVDLHSHILELSDRPVQDLFSRSQLAPCGEDQIRVLCMEDHLALLAIHLLKHGAWRPLWLCDVALILESMPSDFDWKLCLGGRRANWILCAIGLAHVLLGAKINDREIEAATRQFPTWLRRRVLAEWETPFTTDHPPLNYRAPMRSYLRDPRGVLSDLVRRWPNPITSTINVNGNFNNLPRLPYQLGDLVTRGARFLRHLPAASHITQPLSAD